MLHLNLSSVWVCAHMHVHACVSVCLSVSLYVRLCVRLCICMYICLSAFVYIRTCHVSILEHIKFSS